MVGAGGLVDVVLEGESSASDVLDTLADSGSAEIKERIVMCIFVSGSIKLGSARRARPCSAACKSLCLTESSRRSFGDAWTDNVGERGGTNPLLTYFRVMNFNRTSLEALGSGFRPESIFPSHTAFEFLLPI